MTTASIDSALIRCQSCRAINRVPVKRLRENPLCGKCKNLLDYPMKAVQATAATFEQEVSSWPESVLVLYRSQDCPDCKLAEAVMDDVAFLRAGRLKVLKVDAGNEPALARSHAIVFTPTFLMLRNGMQIARLDGIPREKSELHQWIEMQLNKQ
jgi:thioredoxin 2